jgi:hypothetical protein
VSGIMTRRQPDLTASLALVRSEFEEMPGLCLTKPQFRKLWGLDAPECDRLIEALLASNFLRLTSSGRYVWAGRTVPTACPCH